MQPNNSTTSYLIINLNKFTSFHFIPHDGSPVVSLPQLDIVDTFVTFTKWEKTRIFVVVVLREDKKKEELFRNLRFNSSWEFVQQLTGLSVSTIMIRYTCLQPVVIQLHLIEFTNVKGIEPKCNVLSSLTLIIKEIDILLLSSIQYILVLRRLNILSMVRNKIWSEITSSFFAFSTCIESIDLVDLHGFNWISIVTFIRIRWPRVKCLINTVLSWWFISCTELMKCSLESDLLWDKGHLNDRQLFVSLCPVSSLHEITALRA